MKALFKAILSRRVQGYHKESGGRANAFPLPGFLKSYDDIVFHLIVFNKLYQRVSRLNWGDNPSPAY